MVTGLPRVVEVPAKEIAVAMSEIIHQILDAVKDVLNKHRQKFLRTLLIIFFFLFLLSLPEYILTETENGKNKPIARSLVGLWTRGSKTTT